jgi:hypothetical protein
MQLGLRMAESCDVSARVRAVVRQNGGLGRWCWRSAGRGRIDGCRAAVLKLCHCCELLGELLASSSLSEHPVSTPLIAVTTSSLCRW